MTVPVVVTFHQTNENMWGKKRTISLKKKRERTALEKITRLENVVRSRVCLVMRKRFLCSSNYIMPFLFVCMF